MNFIRSDDVLAVLPTGFGKSLLFQLIPGFCVELHNFTLRAESPSIFLDKSGRGRRLRAASRFFDPPLIRENG